MALKYFTQDCDYKLKDRRKIASVAAFCAENEGFKSGEVSVIICSDNYLLSINNQYLGHNYFTDVITFDYTDCDAKIVSGDIFISIDTVADNAAEFGITTVEELKRVIIHGVLHLCGYKDKSPEEEKIMRAKEDFYLARFKETIV